jgi:hypothetical protein
MDERKYILFIKLLNFEFQYKTVGVVLREQYMPYTWQRHFLFTVSAFTSLKQTMNKEQVMTNFRLHIAMSISILRAFILK